MNNESEKIIDILKSKRTLSFEVFPPKADSADMDAIFNAASSVAALKPDFVSVTYGAGGSTSKNTVDMSCRLQKKYEVPFLAHMTCLTLGKSDVDAMLDRYDCEGVKNIMALRGDRPQSGEVKNEFKHACDLVAYIKSRGDYSVGGACYPEVHPECEHVADDICNLKTKIEAGCDFLTTQMFFDNNILYSFLFKLRDAGIDVPIVAGIMPITNAKQLKRSIAISGTNVPMRFRRIVDVFGDDPEAMKQAGVAYATEQIIDLFANGVNNVHVYSMNKPDVAMAIKRNIDSIV